MKRDGIEHDSMTGLDMLHFLDSLSTMMRHLKSLDEASQQDDRSSQKVLDLRLELENFGPVRKGTVRLRPLTILVGPNNSGKSYVAVLVHSILSAVIPYATEVTGGAGTEKINIRLPQTTSGTAQKMVSRRILRKIYDAHTRRFGEKIGEKLSYNFKSNLHELVRNGCNAARVSISNGNEIDITIKNKIAAKSKLTNKKFKIELTEDVHKDPVQVTETEVILNATPNMMDLMPYTISLYVGFGMLPQLPQSHYLPANRSGILQAYKTLAANFTTAIPSIGPLSGHMLTELASNATNTLPGHTLTGTITDFIAKLITIPDKEGRLAGVARQMERALLRGSIDLPRSRDRLPDIMYSAQGHKIPLHRASSSVSEAAPLSLYLKHITKPGDLLIIEEPESHMHPANQAAMATSIVRMIRAGLNVLITTHSPLLVEKLGQYVVAGMADPNARAGHKPYNKDYLLPDEVSPYVFRRSGDGYLIREIDKDDEYGISQEEFIPVLDELNDESIMLQEKLVKGHADYED